MVVKIDHGKANRDDEGRSFSLLLLLLRIYSTNSRGDVDKSMGYEEWGRQIKICSIESWELAIVYCAYTWV